MHYFELRNFQHVILYLLPTLAGVFLLAIGLAGSHFHTKNSEKSMHEVHTTYVDGIEERNAPFPLVLMLIIGGTVLWGLLYTILYGVLEVKI